jgi:hypothetical protein
LTIVLGQLSKLGRTDEELARGQWTGAPEQWFDESAKILDFPIGLSAIQILMKIPIQADVFYPI